MLLTTLLLVALLFMLWREISLLNKRVTTLEEKLRSPVSPSSSVIPEQAMAPDSLPDELAAYKDIIPKNDMFEPGLQGSRALQPTPLVDWIRTKAFRGNPIANIGILVLFIGIAFLLKYTAHYNLIPIVWRLWGVAAAGLLMILAGLRMKGARTLYGTILAGGGVGTLYLTVYTASQFYHFILPIAAFALLFGIVMLSGVIALLRNAKLLAVIGIIGGFLAPILIATGANNFIALFSYYAVLNISILFLAWFKSWRELNLMGFLFTFFLSALWGWQAYQPTYRWQTESFLIYFFLYYVLVALIVAWRQPREEKGLISTALVFGTPIAAFGLQVGLVQMIPYALASSALTLSLFYAILASAIYLFRFSALEKLIDPFAAIALLFATITIPLTFSTVWSSADWALESILLLWFGVRKDAIRVRLFGAAVLVASMMMFFSKAWTLAPAAHFFNDLYLSAALIFIASIIDAYYFYSVKNLAAHAQDWFYQSAREIEKVLAPVFFMVGVVGWYGLHFHQINLYTPSQYMTAAQLLLVMATSLLAWVNAEWLKWPWLRYTSLLLIGGLIAFSFQPHSYFLISLGSTFIWYSILLRHEEYPATYLSLCHFVSLLFVTVLLSHALANQLPVMWDNFLWVFLIWGYVPAFMLYLVSVQHKWLTWPIAQYRKAYQWHGGLVLMLFLATWLIASNTHSGDMALLVYVPFFNPLDIAIVFILGGLVLWIRSAKQWLNTFFGPDTAKTLLRMTCLLGFIALNAVLCRTLHAWTAIPYQLSSLWQSMLVQACFSILWTSVALIATFVAARVKDRALWFIGFALILVVIAKLFLIDLSNTNALQQVLTFIGVGVLLLINGYISPLPPKK